MNNIYFIIFIFNGVIMGKLKVVDFDYGCGGFTKGLEDTKLFEVVYNGSINDMNRFCYNKVHCNSFSEEDFMPRDADLVVFTPNLGQKLSHNAESNFVQSQLDNFTVLSTLYDFNNLIFITQREAFPFLQISSKIFYTSDGFPTRDIISCRLLDLGYNVYNFILDGAGFGLCQHKYYNIYWASKDVDASIYIEEGFGMYKRKYRKVKNALKDLTDDSRVSWHNPDYSKSKQCSYVVPGGSARTTKQLSQTQGYVRLDANKIAKPLSYTFYRVSGKGPSIHPYYDRPLTIREGARLFGLTDDFAWDYSLQKKDVAMMIYESFPPFISKLMGYKISKLIKNGSL